MYTNTRNLPLSLQVWLAKNDYDHNPNPKAISVTTLLKPLKAIVLEKRLKKETTIDISQNIPSRIGTAIHTSVEHSWINSTEAEISSILRSLGYEDGIASNFSINALEAKSEALRVHLEQRSEKEVNGYTVSGKYDFVCNGRLEDLKNTKVYGYLKGSNKKEYILQASIYKWLNPKIITEDTFLINYIFTDWNIQDKYRNPNYPEFNVLPKEYPLMSIPETEIWVQNRISQIDNVINSEQKNIPRCTDMELWKRDSQWKYYKNPSNLSRATKIFKSELEANIRLADDKFVGKLVKIEGKVIRCKYCKVRAICEQAIEYTNTGLIKD